MSAVLLGLVACREAPSPRERILVPQPYPTDPVPWTADADRVCGLDPWEAHRLYGPRAGTAFGRTIAAADRDDDGLDDLAVSAFGEPVFVGLPEDTFVLYRSSAGGVEELHEDDAPADVLARGGDIDGDGLEELLAGADGEVRDTVTVVFGARDGATSRRFATEGGPGVATVGDEGGAYADLLVAGPEPDTISRFEGRSPGLLPLRDEAFAGDPGLGAGLAPAGDVDGDGRPDAVALDAAGDLWLFRGGRPLADALEVDAAAADAVGGPVAADVDGDGFGDVLVRRPDGASFGTLDWWWGGPDGLAAGGSVAVGLTGGGSWGAVGLGDLDGDGDDEIAVGAPAESDGSGTVVVHPGGPDGPGEAALVVRVSGACALGGTLAAADVDGDGLLDLVTTHRADALGFDVGAVSILTGDPAWVR